MGPKELMQVHVLKTINQNDCYSTVTSINTAETVSDKLNVDSQMLKASNGLQRVY